MLFINRLIYVTLQQQPELAKKGHREGLSTSRREAGWTRGCQERAAGRPRRGRGTWGTLRTALARPAPRTAAALRPGGPTLLLDQPPRRPSELRALLQLTGHPRGRALGCSGQHSPGGVPFWRAGVEGIGREKDSPNGYASWPKKTLYGGRAVS